MAKRRSRRTTTATMNPRRRRRGRPRRRSGARRRRNPGFKIMPALVAGLGGAAIGAGAYALEGVALSKMVQSLILAGGGLAIGALAAGWNQNVGAGIAGAGLGLGAKGLLEEFVTAKPAETSGLGRIPNYAVRKFGHTPTQAAYRHLPMQAQLNAVQANLGAVRARMY